MNTSFQRQFHSLHMSYDRWGALFSQAQMPNAIKHSSQKVGQRYVQVFFVGGEQEGSGEPLALCSKSLSLPEMASQNRQVEEEQSGTITGGREEEHWWRS